MIKNIVFDLGGVLIDWNPRYLFQKIFLETAPMEDFLSNICTTDWNEKQDAGRSFNEAVNELAAKHPEFQKQIRAYDERWEEMLKGPIAPTVDILKTILADNRFRVLALTNWSKEKFPIAQKKFDFLARFEGIVVSGHLGMKKPDPRIFAHLCEKYSLIPSETLFIDDVVKNTQAAFKFGMQVIHFQSPEQLQEELIRLHVL